VEFSVLGPVTARHDGRELPLGGPKQRGLLAILLLHANEVVSRDRLIDGLWGERPPPTAGHTLDNYVSRLRKVVGDARLSRRPPGYVLHVERDELDLDCFERLFQEGREALARGAAGEAAATLRSALARWRGAALADLLYEPFAATESERLEERRIMALEDRIDADLALGRSGELVPELEALVREHPLRERLLAQLMLALYRSGRQAEALAAFQAARQRLAEELGLEPGPQLRELEQRILEHDPGLAARRRWLARVQRRRLRPVAVAVAVAAVAASIAVGIIVGLGETTASDVGLGTSNELVEVSTSSSRAVDTLPLEGAPSAIAAAGASLWVADPDSALVSRVSTSSDSVVDRIPVFGQPAAIAVAGGSVWVANTVGGEVSRIDPHTGTIAQTVPLGGSLTAVAAGRHELWVAEGGDKALIRIDSETGIPTQTVSLAEQPSGLAVGYGAVWVASHDAGTVAQIDSRSNRPVATIHVGQGPSALAVGAGSAWVANNLDGTVSRLDPGTSRVVATIAVGSGPVALAFAEGSLWVANKFSKTVEQIDPHRNAVVSTVDTGGRPASLAVTAGRLWIGTRPSGDAHRGGTLTLLGFRPSSIDPAFIQVEYPPTQFSGLTYDTLVTFERASGPEGLQLIPDLALAVPNPTDGGRTYVFRLRPGIHYSDGRPLRASDFRRGLERLFRIGSPGAGNYTAILGGAACARIPRSCELSRGIVVDDHVRTVAFRLAEPDPYLLPKLSLSFAVPVPPGTPPKDVGFRPIPGTGPYRIVRATARETRFSRNPRFREWSHAAQPDGYPDVIVWRHGLSAAAQVRAVADGRADWMFEQIPPKLRSEIELHHPAQLRVNPVLGTEFLQIDTQMPPFDDIRVRRALNYAIDRERIARLYGGASLAQPTCQIVPPGLPGYRRYCRYTLGPRRDGRWRRADAARARQLVAASGTSDARVSVWAASDEAFHASVMRYVAEVLRRLGYRPHVRVVARGAYNEALHTGRVPLKPVTWYGGDLGAADFLRTWFACDGAETRGRFCDPELDRLMRRASTLEAANPRRAATLWASVDRGVADAGAAIPLVTPRAVEFVSARVRNYQAHPISGLIVDQVWLR
jgi:peptide/nickel transport system substrate-binding protein